MVDFGGVEGLEGDASVFAAQENGPVYGCRTS
jgi:hypothetical protein